MRVSNFSHMVLGAITLAYITATSAFASQLSQARSAYESGEYHVAFQQLKAMADDGQPEAAFWAGVMWHKGLGTPQNYETAVSYYRQSAMLGNVDAQNNLGLMYRDGLGVRANQVTALAWFKTAQISGSRIATRNSEALSENMDSKNIQQSLLLSQRYYQKAAQKMAFVKSNPHNIPEQNAPITSLQFDTSVKVAHSIKPLKTFQRVALAQPKAHPNKSSEEQVKNGPYMVQIGVFGNLLSIANVEKKMAQNNISVHKEKLPVGERTLYRLRIGPFITHAMAQASEKELNALLSLKTLIVKGDL